MKKLFTMLSFLITAISLISFFVNLGTVISKRNWVKIEAVVSSVLLPDGIVCGDFTDMNGIMHTDEPLFTDFRFQKIRAVKKVNQEKINKYIGKKIIILYNPEVEKEVKNYDKIRNYNAIIRKIIISSIIALLSSLVSLFLVFQNRKILKYQH